MVSGETTDVRHSKPACALYSLNLWKAARWRGLRHIACYDQTTQPRCTVVRGTYQCDRFQPVIARRSLTS